MYSSIVVGEPWTFFMPVPPPRSVPGPETAGVICHERPYLSLSQPHCSASGTTESFSQSWW